jgi:hypothetical protein
VKKTALGLIRREKNDSARPFTERLQCLFSSMLKKVLFCFVFWAGSVGHSGRHLERCGEDV